ncbi:glycosyltransferase [Gorillibacterium timonense]|uniref:glycosyltransferase n=1 Tax=Gorillibacterium timonense TaxID=1689269 RepID=UPI00071D919E|nr:glycosyltransferase [Gorillibacterium timonense]
MKKRLLFVTQYLHTGGAEKSLLTLLSELDYDKYEADLLLFDHSGKLFPMVPPEVNVLPPLFPSFTMPLGASVPYLLRERKYRLLTGKVMAAALGRTGKGKGVGKRWAVYRHALPRQKTYYDAAISYLDFFCNYYVAEKVQASRKILYNHMDYGYSQEQGWPCPEMERRSFGKCDYIVTVAESARDSLASHFPEFSRQIRVIHNRVSETAVREMAREPVPEAEDSFAGITIVTVARLGDEKGVRLALEACRLLDQEGYPIRWNLIGGGPLESELKQRAEELGLSERFRLLGEQANPYPYMSRCDIYVQPSKTEAHCIAVEEALALSRPVVVTDIPSFRKQIDDGETGILVPVTPEGIASGIRQLIDQPELRVELTDRLERSGSRHAGELAKFCLLLEGEFYETVV